jgi:hypothetical protein
MEVEQYAWATEELIRNARATVLDLEEGFRSDGELILFFIPLADFNPSGSYRLGPETSHFICYPDGAIEWHFPVQDDAFTHFEKECRAACDTLQSYLIRLLSYAMAHGMDVAKADGESGRSILHALPHSAVHADVEYEG